MKKIIFSLALVFSALSAMAEDAITVKPFNAEIGIEENEWEFGFSIELENEVADNYIAFQFDLYLPEGMKLIEDGPMDLNEDRFNGTVIKRVWTADATLGVADKGTFYRITLYDDKAGTIHGTSGEILKVYYTTKDMKEGSGKLAIRNQELTTVKRTAVNPADVEVDVNGVTAVSSVKADGADSARKVAKDGKIVIVQEDGTEVSVDAIVQ